MIPCYYYVPSVIMIHRESEIEGAFHSSLGMYMCTRAKDMINGTPANYCFQNYPHSF